MTNAQLVELAVGPAGGLAICLLVMVTAYRFTVKHLLPLATQYITSTEERWVGQLTEHKQDRAAFRDSLKELSTSYSATSTELAEVKVDVKAIKNKVGA